MVVPIVSLLIFIVAMWQFLPTIDEREFHRDEARWIHRAEYVRELSNPFGDYWDESTWADGETLDHRNRLRAQPPVGSYLMGIGFLLQGQPLPDIGFGIWTRAPSGTRSKAICQATRCWRLPAARPRRSLH